MFEFYLAVLIPHMALLWRSTKKKDPSQKTARIRGCAWQPQAASAGRSAAASGKWRIAV